MLNLTAQAKQAWLAQTRQVNARVTIGTTVYNADKIMSIEYDSGSISGETFQIGSFYQNSIKVVLVGILESLANDNKVRLEFAVKVGQAFEWVNMGTFYVTELDRDRNSNRTTFTAVDASVYLGKNYAPTISFPNSLKNLVTDIANQCGVQVNFASMTHLADVNVTQPPSKYTCRQVISMVAQIHGGFARINRNDQLEVTRLMSSDIELSPSHYLLKGLTKNETTYRTDGIIVKIGENEEDVLKVGTTTGSAVINLENPLMTQTLLDEMWRVVSIISYYPFNLKWRGIPNLEAGDWITIVDKQGTRYRVPNLSYKLSFKGGLSAESSANTTATSNVQHKLRGTLTQRVEDVEGYINATGGRSYTGLDVPDNKYLKKGDTWYKPDGDDTAILVYDGEKWEEVASPEVFRKLQADFDELDKQAKEAFEQVDTLVQESPETKRLAQEAQEAVNLANKEITKLQTSVSDTKTALQNAEQEFAESLATTTRELTAKISGIDVGGRNILRGTKDMKLGSGKWAEGTWRQYNTGTTKNVTLTDFPLANITQGIEITSDSSECGIAQDYLKLESGEYTLSYYVKAKTANTTVRLQTFFNSENSGIYKDVVLKDTNWTRLSVTGELKENQDTMSAGYIYVETPNSTITVACAFEHRSEVVGEWSPAPEDFQSDLSNTSIELSTKITESAAKLRTEMSEKYSTKNDLTTLQGEYNSFKEETAKKISQQVSSIETVQTNTTEAQKLAGEAYNKAQSATTSATNASSTANSALDKASNATNVANSASQNATNAVANANSAVSAANTAKDNANKAIADVAALTKTVTAQGTKIDQTSSRIDLVASGITEVGNKVDSLKLVGENLILNGYGEFGNNKNFNNYIFDGTNSYNNKPSFKTNLKTTLPIGNSRISIDINKAYQFSMNIKSDNGGTIYLGWDEYDIDGYYISPTYAMGFPNTATSLARDLNDGDTVVYLESTANWVSSNYTHQNGLIFWNYRDSTGYLYPEGVYSRNAWTNLYTKETVNKTNNTITLKSPWTHGTIKAGTRVSQSNSQGHKYRNFVNTSVPSSWTNTSFIIGEDHRLQSPYSFDNKRFSPAAKSISFMAMWSYGTSVVDTYYINSVELKNIDDKLLIDGINSNIANNYYQKTTVDSKISTATSGITAQYTQDITTRLGNYYDKSTIDSKLTIDGQGITSYVKSTKSKLDNLQIGGANLVRDTGEPFIMGYGIPNTTWENGRAILRYGSGNNPMTKIEILPQGGAFDEFVMKRGVVYTQSIIVETDATFISNGEFNFSWFRMSPTAHNHKKGNIKKTGNEQYLIWCTASVNEDNFQLRAFDVFDLQNVLSFNNSGSYIAFSKPKLEEGNMPTAWSPAPEDMATLTQYTEVKQLADRISSTVYDSASGLVTKTTQLAGKYAIQNLNSYGDVLSSLNLNGGNVRIKGSLIYLDGNVLIQDGFVKNLKANSILANEITAKATTIVNAKIANLDAGVITTGILKGTNLSLNLGTGEVQFQKGRIQAPNNTLDIQVNTGIMKVLNTNGEGVTFQNGNLYFSNANVQGYYGSLLYNTSIDGAAKGVRINGLGGVVLASKSQTGLILNGSFSDIKNGASLNLIEHSDGKGYAYLLSQNSIKIAVNKKRESTFGYAFTGINIYKETDTIDLTAGTTQIYGDIMNLSGNTLYLNNKEIYSSANKVTFNNVVNFSGNVNFSQKVNNNYLALGKTSQITFDVKGGLSSAYLEVTHGLFTYKIPLQS